MKLLQAVFTRVSRMTKKKSWLSITPLDDYEHYISFTVLRMALSHLSSAALCLWPFLKAKPNKRAFHCPISPCPPQSTSHCGQVLKQTNKQNQTQYTQIQQSGFGSLLRSQIPLFNCPTKFGWVKRWCSKKPFWYYLKGKRTGKEITCPRKSWLLLHAVCLPVLKQVKFPHLSFGDSLRIPSHIT